MKFKPFRIDRCWKILIYFDLILPAILYLIALLFPLSGIRSAFANLFHSYGLYVMKTLPDPASFSGIVGLLYHGAAMFYTARKRNTPDLLICMAITILVTFYFAFDINYQIIKPLSFR
jgi:hypothetical protein